MTFNHWVWIKYRIDSNEYCPWASHFVPNNLILVKRDALHDEVNADELKWKNLNDRIEKFVERAFQEGIKYALSDEYKKLEKGVKNECNCLD